MKPGKSIWYVMLISLLVASCNMFVDESQQGRVFYLDPVAGSLDGDGSRSAPWPDLETFLAADLIRTHHYTSYPWSEDSPIILVHPDAPVQAGDTLRLLPGHHGSIDIWESYNVSPITIEAEQRHAAMVSQLHINSSSGFIIRGLTVRPDVGAEPGYASLVRVSGHNWRGPAHDVLVEDCYVYSTEDSSGWSKEDWNTRAFSGISANGDFIRIVDNELRNVNFGITYTGNFGIVQGNTIANFAGDGMRGIGNDLLFEGNLVMDNYNVNGNHDDGFQSWSLGDRGQPPRERVVLRGNTIINNTDPDRPFQGGLQGIGCFDGFFIDWVVENNLVIVDHWHGITFSGAIGVVVRNNTVVDPGFNRARAPWIRISAHKDGRPSHDCRIQNNIAHAFSLPEAYGTATHNIQISSQDMLQELFRDPGARDFRLKKGSAAIDAGRTADRAVRDIEGIFRPRGQGVDVGVYESF
ncbi:MAG: choice-of-anchor Q domain-containing protein [Spirochaeta sp.]